MVKRGEVSQFFVFFFFIFAFIYPRFLSLCYIFFRSFSILSRSAFLGDVEVALFEGGTWSIGPLALPSSYYIAISRDLP